MVWCRPGERSGQTQEPDAGLTWYRPNRFIWESIDFDVNYSLQEWKVELMKGNLHCGVAMFCVVKTWWIIDGLISLGGFSFLYVIEQSVETHMLCFSFVLSGGMAIVLMNFTVLMCNLLGSFVNLYAIFHPLADKKIKIIIEASE